MEGLVHLTSIWKNCSDITHDALVHIQSFKEEKLKRFLEIQQKAKNEQARNKGQGRRGRPPLALPDSSIASIASQQAGRCRGARQSSSLFGTDEDLNITGLRRTTRNITKNKKYVTTSTPETVKAKPRGRRGGDKERTDSVVVVTPETVKKKPKRIAKEGKKKIVKESSGEDSEDLEDKTPPRTVKAKRKKRNAKEESVVAEATPVKSEVASIVHCEAGSSTKVTNDLGRLIEPATESPSTSCFRKPKPRERQPEQSTVRDRVAAFERMATPENVREGRTVRETNGRQGETRAMRRSRSWSATRAGVASAERRDARELRSTTPQDKVSHTPQPRTAQKASTEASENASGRKGRRSKALNTDKNSIGINQGDEPEEVSANGETKRVTNAKFPRNSGGLKKSMNAIEHCLKSPAKQRQVSLESIFVVDMVNQDALERTYIKDTVAQQANLGTKEPEDILNATTVLPLASKRTKPVIKSKVFDEQGNNLLTSKKNSSGEDVAVAAPMPAKRTKRQVKDKTPVEEVAEETKRSIGAKRARQDAEEPIPKRSSRTKPTPEAKHGKLELPEVQHNEEPIYQRATRTKKIVKDTEDILPLEEPFLQRATRTKKVVKDTEDPLPNEDPILQRATRTKKVVKDTEEIQLLEEPFLQRATRTKKVVKDTEDPLPIEEPILQRATRTKRIVKSTEEAVQICGELIVERSTRTKTKQAANPLNPIGDGPPVIWNEPSIEDAYFSASENASNDVHVVRVTRTKTKAIDAANLAARKSGLSVMAQQSLNKAKRMTLKRVVTEEASGSTNEHGRLRVPLLSSTNKIRTPMAKYPVGYKKKVGSSLSKTANRPVLPSKFPFENSVGKFKRQGSTYSIVTPVVKPGRGDPDEKHMSTQKKDEEARRKKKEALEQKQKELKEKNEIKRKKALEQREKLDTEKHNLMVQSEKEKEEKTKMILHERELKIKEGVMRKKMLMEQKLAENEERRRVEEEARIAKLKEMEAEQQRIALQKQKEQERYEKRLKEREAEKRAKEDYEAHLRLEKAMALKKAAMAASAAKKARTYSATKEQERRIWMGWEARNADDYGLEDELTEIDSDDDNEPSSNKPVPKWAQDVMKGGGSKIMDYISLRAMTKYMPCVEKTPDIHKMFNMTPSKRIKRTSSAIWNSPSENSFADL